MSASVDRSRPVVRIGQGTELLTAAAVQTASCVAFLLAVLPSGGVLAAGVAGWIGSATGLYVLGGGALALVAFAVWAWGCCASQQRRW